jgi:hypothetical protein
MKNRFVPVFRPCWRIITRLSKPGRIHIMAIRAKNITKLELGNEK